MNARQTAAEAVRQMADGEDYTPLPRLIKDLTSEQAAQKPLDFPYSIATVVWHAEFWICAWIAMIEGGDPFRGYDPDASWPDVPPAGWPEARDGLLRSLQEARALAVREEIKTGEDSAADRHLLQIAVHTAYHIGQVALLRQSLGLWPPAGGE